MKLAAVFVFLVDGEYTEIPTGTNMPCPMPNKKMERIKNQRKIIAEIF